MVIIFEDGGNICPRDFVNQLQDYFVFIGNISTVKKKTKLRENYVQGYTM